MKPSKSTDSPLDANSSPLRITIPDLYHTELYPPLPVHAISPPSSPEHSSWTHPYPSSSALPSPLSASPAPAYAEVAPAPSGSGPPPVPETNTVDLPSTSEQCPSQSQNQSQNQNQSYSQRPPFGRDIFQPLSRKAEPPSPGVASLVGMIVHTPSKTDLMGEGFHAPSPVFPSPVPHEGSHFQNVPGSRRSLLSISMKPPSPPSSPASAVALSSPILRPINQAPPQSARSSEDQGMVPSCLPQVPRSAGSQQSRHSTFYLQEEMVVIEVQGCLYRVHRHLLERNSDFFRRLLTGNQNSTALGGSDDSAISLPDVTRHDFDRLLDFLYYRVFEDEAVSLDDWVVLLDVSTRLRFTKIRARAIREISAQHQSLSAVQLIVLAVRHDVPGWLPEAYADLCRRAYPLSDLEAEQLGAQTTARIGRAREAIRDETYRAFQQKRYGSRYAPPETTDEELVSRVVMDVFWPRDLSKGSL